MEMKTPEEKIELLQKSLVEHRCELQDSVDDISTGIMDLRREVQLALIRIKEKMGAYLAVILFVMFILVKALAFALQQP